MSYQIPVDILFDQCTKPPPGKVVIEPFAGDGQVITWLGLDYIIIPYDKDPTFPKVMKNDVFDTKIRYGGAYVITRPPQLKKKDATDKEIYARYGCDDLYKIFINFFFTDQPIGGIIVVPISFLNGSRESEMKRRNNFFKIYEPTRFNVFDKNTVVIQFKKRYGNIYDYNNKEFWNFNFYDDQVLTSHLIYSINPYDLHIPVSNHFEFSLKNEPSKKIHLRYEDPNTQVQPNETITKLGLYGSEHIEGLYIDPTPDMYIVVKGFMSLPLQERVVNDFNNWLSRYNLITPKHFRKELTPEIVLEAIRRIIYSYFISSD